MLDLRDFCAIILSMIAGIGVVVSIWRAYFSPTALKTKKTEDLVMPDFNKKYRVTTKNNKYRLEGSYSEGWVVLSRLMDDIEKAKKLKMDIIINQKEEWIIKNDKDGWTVVE